MFPSGSFPFSTISSHHDKTIIITTSGHCDLPTRRDSLKSLKLPNLVHVQLHQSIREAACGSYMQCYLPTAELFGFLCPAIARLFELGWHVCRYSLAYTTMFLSVRLVPDSMTCRRSCSKKQRSRVHCPPPTIARRYRYVQHLVSSS